ncbi:MAG: rsmB [Bacillota bacterium]|jgi:16S rRNA (cytosine967-C5)-methyltransferase|nr:rsmB [Bacillota bacterium]
MENNYRVSVIESLKKIFIDNSYSNLIINHDVKNVNIKYNGLYRKSVLGVIENLMFIDYIINQMSKTKTKKMEHDVLFVLRLAVYQIFFLENSYENIVVNESVEYIKEKGNIRASKFINAVLRNILRNKENLLKSMEKLNKNDYLSIKYSYPKWLVEKWAKQFGKDQIENVLSWNNSQAPLEIRVNTLKTNRDELISLLNEKSMNAKKCQISNKGIEVENPTSIDNMVEFKNGLFSIQSESSMLVGQVLNPKENSLIVDVCAAPGGKSLNVAELMNNTGLVISRDLYKGKIPLIVNEAKRLGITNIQAESYDATKLDDDLIGKADYVIVDVPCSGLGIIRRKPEIKYNKSELILSDIEYVQYKILENACKYLKQNGELIYSTCTTEKKENLDIINKFLEENENFKLMDISEETGNYFDTAKDGFIEVYPHIHHMDGFFIAKLKKL